MLYRIERIYRDKYRRQTLPGKSGLYLEEAQAHCRDPESSSATATSAAARACTRRNGPWFDSYVEDRPRRRSR